jgi:hypothetical protein
MGRIDYWKLKGQAAAAESAIENISIWPLWSHQLTYK